MNNLPIGKVGIQAVSLGGSFHEIAAREMLPGILDEQLKPFETHQELINNLRDPRGIGSAVIAIDSNGSGRVQTAIDAIRSLRENYSIFASHTIPVPQHLLTYPSKSKKSITQVISQRPALDQCEQYIKENHLIEIEEKDTLLSAQIVARSHGIINGKRTAAIASKLAGITTGLEIGPAVNDIGDNATKFWLISREKNVDNQGDHAALVFEVPSEKGELYRAIKIISDDFNYDLTDIDTHLEPHKSKNRAFFVEIKRHNQKDMRYLIQALNENNFDAKLLGVYNSSKNDLIVTEKGSEVPRAIEHDRWQAHHGLELTNGTTVFHVVLGNEKKALLKVLSILKWANLADMSRPTTPINENFKRGFYFVLDPETDYSTIKNIEEEMKIHKINFDSLRVEQNRLLVI